MIFQAEKNETPALAKEVIGVVRLKYGQTD